MNEAEVSNECVKDVLSLYQNKRNRPKALPENAGAVRVKQKKVREGGLEQN